jgi:hypothetical protein
MGATCALSSPAHLTVASARTRRNTSQLSTFVVSFTNLALILWPQGAPAVLCQIHQLSIAIAYTMESFVGLCGCTASSPSQFCTAAAGGDGSGCTRWRRRSRRRRLRRLWHCRHHSDVMAAASASAMPPIATHTSTATPPGELAQKLRVAAVLEGCCCRACGTAVLVSRASGLVDDEALGSTGDAGVVGAAGGGVMVGATRVGVTVSRMAGDVVGGVRAALVGDSVVVVGSSVGDQVGRDVGDDEGECVGELVVTVGVCVGVVDGDHVWPGLVGEMVVGDDVGATVVGVAEGAELGAREGLVVDGDAEGATVGAAVGTELGPFVGTAVVGDRVGEAVVGVRDGESVSPGAVGAAVEGAAVAK